MGESLEKPNELGRSQSGAMEQYGLSGEKVSLGGKGYKIYIRGVKRSRGNPGFFGNASPAEMMMEAPCWEMRMKPARQRIARVGGELLEGDLAGRV